MYSTVPICQNPVLCNIIILSIMGRSRNKLVALMILTVLVLYCTVQLPEKSYLLKYYPLNGQEDP